MKERNIISRMIIKLTVILFLLVSTGCATIVSHSNWPIIIRSDPEQADVSITDVKENKKIHEGKTPMTVTASSYGGYFAGKKYMIQVSKDGFETKTTEVNSELNPWYLGNIIFGGLIGILIVDPLTGAMWNLDPKEVVVVLPQKKSETPSDLTKPQVTSPEKPTTSTPATPSSGTVSFVTVTWTSANIQSGAGNDYPVLATVKQGDKLTVIGVSGEWFNVRLENGQEGWISNRVVK